MIGRIYVRLSQESDTSIERQIEFCEEYAKQNDIEVDHIYNDGDHTSGYDSNESERPKYHEMLQDAEGGEFDALIVKHGSRLGRNKKERIRRFFDLDDWHVEFHTVRRGYVDPDDEGDFLQELFSASRDHHGKWDEIQAAKEEIQRRVDDPDCYHGEPPRGLTFDENKRGLVVDDDEREAFEAAMEVIHLRDEDETYTVIEMKTGVVRSRISRILNNQREWFLRAREIDDPSRMSSHVLD